MAYIAYVMRCVLSSFRSFLLYSNVIVTAAAATMTFRSFRLFGLAPDARIITIIAAPTLLVYALHSLSPDERPGSRRDVWNRRNRLFHRLCMTVSFIVLLLGIPDVLEHWVVFSPAVLFTVYYMSAGWVKFPIYAKTLVLALTWTYSTMLMPVLLSGQYVSGTILLPATAIELIYIYLICLFFDYRDASVDDSSSWILRSMFRIRMVIFSSVFFFTLFGYWSWIAGVPGIWVILKSLLMGLLIITSAHSLSTKSDGWYYGFLDGMLALDVIALWFM